MRDPGLSEAIRAAGGVSELARQIGISQPSVSNWSRIPAERVVAVEAVTGVDRAILRPDLYGGTRMAGDIDEVDRCTRAGICAARRAAHARAGRGCWPICRAARRSDTAGPRPCRTRASRQRTSAERVEREYFDLFIGLGRGELMPYGSYYLTGFLHERPLARLREDLGSRSASRAPRAIRAGGSRRNSVRDHGGSGERPSAGAAGLRPQIFEKHLAPWIGRFFADLERAETANFYRRWGRSAGCSWTSKLKPSRCRLRRRRELENSRREWR